MNQSSTQTVIGQSAEELRFLIGQNDVERALKRLLDFARDFSSGNEYVNEAVLASRKWSELSRRKRLGIDSSTDYAENDQVLKLLELIDDIVEHYPDTSSSVQSKYSFREDDGSLHTDNIDPAHQYPKDGNALGGLGLGIVAKTTKASKEYRTSSFSLKPISINLSLGKITGLVGPNASGKTTLLRIIAGEIPPDQGTVGYPLFPVGPNDWYGIKQRVAYIPHALAPWKAPLRTTLHYLAAIKGVRGEDNASAVDYIVQRLDLERYEHLSWDMLSSGYKMRFALASQLVWHPQLLVLDEPIANLDIDTQQILLQDLRDLSSSSRYPIAAIISSQHLHEIEGIADELIFLADGEPRFVGTMLDLESRRNDSIYEVTCSATIDVVTGLLHDFQPLRIEDKGSYWVIHTTRQVSASQIQLRLLNSGVEIKFFRDVSNSVKRFFRDTQNIEEFS